MEIKGGKGKKKKNKTQKHQWFVKGSIFQMFLSPKGMIVLSHEMDNHQNWELMPKINSIYAWAQSQAICK